MGRIIGDSKVESYAGYKGEETPRAVVLDGKRFEVMIVLSRKRILDTAAGRTRDVWHCRLDDGREVIVELLEDGTCRVSTVTP